MQNKSVDLVELVFQGKGSEEDELNSEISDN